MREILTESLKAHASSIQSMREILDESLKVHAAQMADHDRQFAHHALQLADHAAQMKEIRDSIQNMLRRPKDGRR
jgi:hypothetical protein